ncbi:cell division cycle protein [Histomonas meleagridis]|uniref:cell division cycle protein n=1 Tax=Histomonas meleagridis TaxID=135588 RepID=UPI00355A92E1|nr:cell division cycle protein [Histomonas meleagridis]KAH0805801.1 cell division cycle protein [Histomonas meleagridis]
MQGTVAFLPAEDGELHGTPEQKREQVEKLLDFGMHLYYDQIKTEMFPTCFISVSKEQAAAWRCFNIDKEMTPEQQSAFNSLKSELEQAINKIKSTHKVKRVFVKLSSRSAKDAVSRMEKRFLPYLQAEFNKVNIKDDNQKMIALRNSFIKASGVHNSDEAFEMMKWSSRIVSDLKIFLDASGDGDWFDIKLVVRAFNEDLECSQEYRGFVYNRKLTAVSHYQTECYFPEIAAHKDEIGQTFQKYFNDVLLPILPERAKQSCIIDFALIKGKCFVVELNPYGVSTGSALFDWTKDREILEGSKPFEIRVVEKVVDHLDAHFAPWERIIAKATEKKKGFFSKLFNK